MKALNREYKYTSMDFASVRWDVYVKVLNAIQNTGKDNLRFVIFPFLFHMYRENNIT